MAWHCKWIWRVGNQFVSHKCYTTWLYVYIQSKIHTLDHFFKQILAKMDFAFVLSRPTTSIFLNEYKHLTGVIYFPVVTLSNDKRRVEFTYVSNHMFQNMSSICKPWFYGGIHCISTNCIIVVHDYFHFLPPHWKL